MRQTLEWDRYYPSSPQRINTELLLVEIEPKARFLFQALREGKRCVTAHWLNTVLKKKRMVPPHRTLHLPFAFPPGAKPCSQHVRLLFLLAAVLLQSLYLVNSMNFKMLHSSWQEAFLLVRSLLQLFVAVFPQIISVTGFMDADRDDLKLMAYLAGARYTGYLCRSNTVLICKE